mmetsp:Transcript_63499/g.141612  ORF Transcript_63499/g.141612 Transcript_63499/m.141612 type:complete len:110 (-) Transcript_63499:761-1090(-)
MQPPSPARQRIYPICLAILPSAPLRRPFSLPLPRNLDAVNTYGVLTCCSAVLLLPPVMLIEGGAAWATVVAAEDIGMQLMRDMLLCGFLYYAYNECGFRVLDALGSVSA